MRILVRFAFPDTFIFALHIAMKTQCVTQVLVTSRSNEYVTAAEHSGQIAHWYLLLPVMYALQNTYN